LVLGGPTLTEGPPDRAADELGSRADLLIRAPYGVQVVSIERVRNGSCIRLPAPAIRA